MKETKKITSTDTKPIFKGDTQIALMSVSKNMPLAQAIESVKQALIDYQSKNTEQVEQEKPLRHKQLQLDHAIKEWINNYLNENIEENKDKSKTATESQEIKLIDGTENLLLAGLQQRIAIEKALKTVIPWYSSNSLEKENFYSLLNKLYQKIDIQFHELASGQDPNLTKVTLFYNLRMYLLDAIKVRSLKRSIRIGEFRTVTAKLFPVTQHLSEMTTQQLVIRFNETQTPQWQKDQIKKILLGILDDFRQTKVRSSDLIATVIPLAASQDNEIRHHALEAFIKPIRDNVLLDAFLVHGLAQVIRYAYAIGESPDKRPKSSDDLWQTLKVLFKRIADLHSQQGDTEKLQKLLDGLIAVLNAMVDQGASGLPEEKALEFSELLRGLDTYDNPDIQFQVAYARQALARVPDDTSLFVKYFGCSVKIVGSVISLTKGALEMDPSSIVDGLFSLKESVSETFTKVQRDWKSDWYKLLRVAELYFQPDRDALEKLNALINLPPKSRPSSEYEYGILVGLTPIILQTPKFRFFAVRLIKQLTLEKPNKNEKSSKEKKAKKESLQNYVFSLERKLSGSFSYDTKVRQKAAQILKAIKERATKESGDQFVGTWFDDLLKQLQQRINEKRPSKFLQKLSQVPFMSQVPFISGLINFEDNLTNTKLETGSRSQLPQGYAHQIVLTVYRKVLPLEYLLEDLWQQVEFTLHSSEVANDLRYYVPLEGVERAEDLTQLASQDAEAVIPEQSMVSEKVPSTSGVLLFDLEKRVIEILQAPGSQLLLIQGPSGSGKSLFGRHLQQMLWKQYRPGQPIALFISLSQLKDPSKRCVEQTLENAGWNEEAIQLLKREAQAGRVNLTAILDGYDEIKTEKNLYKTNELELWKAKVIITSRLLFGNYQALFRTQTLKAHELFIAPFRPDQVATYIRYIQEEKKVVTANSEQRPLSADELHREFLSVPGLAGLIESPFMLKILVDVWDILKRQARLQATGGQALTITRTQIYHTFITNYYDEQEIQLHKRQTAIPKNFLIRPSFQEFAEELAVEMQVHEQVIVSVKPNQYRKLKDIEQDPWARFFEKTEETTLARMGVPLKYVGSTAQFIHKSIQEYYVACSLVKEITLEGVEQLTEKSDFNRLRLDQEPPIMDFLHEMIQEDPDKIEALFKMILHSRKYPKCARLSANAATLLAFMGVSFNGRDLSGVKIPQARLNSANLDHVNFSQSDLTDVELDAWLGNTNFQGAHLNGVYFGAYPSLIHQAFVYQAIYSPDGCWLAVINNLVIYLCETKSGEYIHTLKGHKSSILNIAFSPDSKLLASGGMDKTAMIWEVESGQLLYTLLGHTGDVRKVIFNSNGQLLATASITRYESTTQPNPDGTIRIWKVKEGQLSHTLTGHKQVNCMTSSSDGKLLASADTEEIRIWDMANEIPLHTLKILAMNPDSSKEMNEQSQSQPQVLTIDNILFSPNRKYLALGTENSSIYSIQFWDVANDQLLRTLPVRGKVCFAFHPNEQKLAMSISLSDPNPSYTVQLWSLTNWQLLHTLTGHTDKITKIIFDPTGNYLVSASYDKTIRIWESESGQLRHTLTGHTAAIIDVMFNPIDDSFLASVGNDKIIRQWDIRRKQSQIRPADHIGVVQKIILNPDDHSIALCTRDKGVQLRHMRTGKFLHKLSVDKSRRIEDIILSSAGKLLIVNSLISLPNQLSNLQVCEREQTAEEASEKILRSLDFQQGCLITGVLWSPTGKQLLISSSNERAKTYPLQLWDITTDQLITLNNEGITLMDNRPFAFFSLNGKLLATVHTQDKQVRIWDTMQGKLLFTISPSSELIKFVTFSMDNQYFTILENNSQEQNIRIWNIATGQISSILEHTKSVQDLAFSPKAGQLASITTDNNVQLWDIVSGQLLQTLSSEVLFRWSNLKIVFNQEGNYVAATNTDKAVRVWQLTTGECLAVLEGYLAPIKHLIWTADDDLITLSADSSLCCWHPVMQSNKIPIWQLAWNTQISLYAKNCRLDQALGLSHKNFRLLQQLGATGHALLTAQDQPDWSPIQLAVANNKLKEVQQLLQIQPASLHSLTSTGDTLLHIAAGYHAAPALITWLLEQGADYQAKNQRGKMPWEIAKENNYLDLLVVLPHLDSKNDDWTYFQVACSEGHVNLVNYLLKKDKEQMKAISEQGNTPLHLAAAKGHVAVMEILVNAGASLEARNNNGATPLHRVLYLGQLQAARWLVENGADVLSKQTTINGKPLEYSVLHLILGNTNDSKFKQNLVIIEFLLSKGVELGICAADGSNPLHIVTGKGFLKITQWLVDQGSIPIDSQQNDGRTPLHLAASIGKLDLVKLLLDRGAKVDIQDKDGRMPFHLAQEKLESQEKLKPKEGDKKAKMPLQVLLENNLKSIIKLLSRTESTPLQAVTSEQPQPNTDVWPKAATTVPVKLSTSPYSFTKRDTNNGATNQSPDNEELTSQDTKQAEYPKHHT